MRHSNYANTVKASFAKSTGMCTTHNASICSQSATSFCVLQKVKSLTAFDSNPSTNFLFYLLQKTSFECVQCFMSFFLNAREGGFMHP